MFSSLIQVIYAQQEALAQKQLLISHYFYLQVFLKLLSFA
jgi:hypothetical protein